jgi:hypothetical protein
MCCFARNMLLKINVVIVVDIHLPLLRAHPCSSVGGIISRVARNVLFCAQHVVEK